MILKVSYESKSQLRVSFVQSFIGVDYDDCWDKKVDFEEFLEALNDNNIRNLYNIKVISNPDFAEWNEKK